MQVSTIKPETCVGSKHYYSKSLNLSKMRGPRGHHFQVIIYSYSGPWRHTLSDIHKASNNLKNIEGYNSVKSHSLDLCCSELHFH